MTSSVVVALRVSASPARAFDVFTAEIGQWWRPSGLFQITPRGDGVVSFEAGEGGRLIATLENGVIYEIGRVTTWTPGERLAFSWRPAALTEDLTTHVDVRFEAVGEETRVTVEHRGWSEIPQEHVARHGFPEHATLMRASEWWRTHLAALAALIAVRR